MALGSTWGSLRSDDERAAYREGFKKKYNKSLNNFEEADAAGQETLAAFRNKQPAAPEQVQQPATMQMQNPFTGSSQAPLWLQRLFAPNRAQSNVTEADTKATEWTAPATRGEAYFRSLQGDKLEKYRVAFKNSYNGNNTEEAMDLAQQAVEGENQSLMRAAKRKILMDSASEDVYAVMTVEKFNSMDEADRDLVLNAWDADQAHGVDAIHRVLRENGLYQKYGINGWDPSAATEDEGLKKPERPTSRRPEDIQKEINQLQYEMAEGQHRVQARPDIADETRDFLRDAQSRLTDLKIELNQATTDWDNYEDAANAYMPAVDTEVDPEVYQAETQGQKIVGGTAWNALNAAAEAYHGLGKSTADTMAYIAGGAENLLGLDHVVSNFFKRSSAGYQRMIDLSKAAREQGVGDAVKGVQNVMSMLLGPEGAERAGKDAETAVKWVEDNIVGSTAYNFGHMVPSMILDIMSGGTTAALDVGRMGAEAAAAWGGRSMASQLASGIQAAMSNPGFGATFAGEYFGNVAEKLDAGEEPTPTDMIWMLASSYVSSLIEYGGDDVASGFQALLMDEMDGLKGFLHAEAGETIEELTQRFTSMVGENCASVLQGKGTKYKLYSDQPGEALINLAEMWETTWQTLVTTGGMTGVHYVAGALRNGIIKATTGEELSADEEQALHDYMQYLDDKAAESEQHQDFENAANGEETAEPEKTEQPTFTADEVRSTITAYAPEDYRNRENAADEDVLPDVPGTENQGDPSARAEDPSATPQDKLQGGAAQDDNIQAAANPYESVPDGDLQKIVRLMANDRSRYTPEQRRAAAEEMERRGLTMPAAAAANTEQSMQDGETLTPEEQDARHEAQYKQLELAKIQGLDRRALMELRDRIQAGEDVGVDVTADDITELLKSGSPKAIDWAKVHAEGLNKTLEAMDNQELMDFANGQGEGGTDVDRQQARQMLNERRRGDAVAALREASAEQIRQEIEARKTGDGADAYIDATDEDLERILEQKVRDEESAVQPEKPNEVVREGEEKGLNERPEEAVEKALGEKQEADEGGEEQAPVKVRGQEVSALSDTDLKKIARLWANDENLGTPETRQAIFAEMEKRGLSLRPEIQTEETEGDPSARAEDPSATPQDKLQGGAAQDDNVEAEQNEKNSDAQNAEKAPAEKERAEQENVRGEEDGNEQRRTDEGQLTEDTRPDVPVPKEAQGAQPEEQKGQPEEPRNAESMADDQAGPEQEQKNLQRDAELPHPEQPVAEHPEQPADRKGEPAATETGEGAPAERESRAQKNRTLVVDGEEGGEPPANTTEGEKRPAAEDNGEGPEEPQNGENKEPNTPDVEPETVNPENQENKEQNEERQRLEKETEEVAQTNHFKTGVTNGDGRGDTGVHLVRTGALDKTKVKELQLIDRVAKRFGFSVEVREDLPHDANGMYRQGERTIYINPNAENALLTVAGHEMYHMVKNQSSKTASQIEKIFDKWAETANFHVDEEIENVIANYAKQGTELTEPQAKEELIANSMYSLLTDEQTLRQVYNADHTLYQRVMDFVHKVQQAIQEMLRDYEEYTPEARMLAKQEGALSEMHQAMLAALEDMRGLEDVKKAAAAEHGNGEITRKYEQAVREATSREQITDAGRELAKDVLRQTGNEVNDNNIQHVINAASDVANGAQAYYAFRDNGLDPTNINEETRRALRMIGGNMRNIMENRNTDEWNAMMMGRPQTESGEKYSLKYDRNGRPYVELDVDQDVFDGLTESEARVKALGILRDRFVNKPISTQHGIAKLSGRGARHIVRSLDWGTKEQKMLKLRASTELDNVMAAAVYTGPEEKKNEHREWLDQNGVDGYDVTIKMGPVKGDYHIVVGLLKVGGREIYGIHFIDAISTGSINAGGEANTRSNLPDLETSASDEMLPENASEVKKKLTTEEAFEADQEQNRGEETHYGDHQSFSLRVRDKKELDFLNNQETYTTYKTMQLVDGKLYPPMAAVVAGSMEDHSELGAWEKATEHPELIRNGNKFTLNKGKGKGSIEAAYNPYMHSSNLMINDQFSGAWNRPDLVTVECEVPASENTSNYHAEYAKDTTGWKSWHTGTVAGQLRNAKGIERQVFLSRWIKPVRIVPDAEVAQHYKDLIQGTNIEIPDNVVSPSLRRALEEAGVPIKVTGKVKESYSLKRSELKALDVESDTDGEQLTEGLEGGTVAKYSLRTWEWSDREKIRKKLIGAGFRSRDVDKWINDVNSIAAMIAQDRTRLDYKASEVQTFLKDNAEYVKTLDSSTLCAKRRLYQGTFDAIQHALPNTVITSDLLIHLRNMMADRNYETPCGICYVESRRRNLGAFTDRFLKNYEGDSTGYKPTMDDLTTTDGLEALREEHPEAYEAYRAAMAKTGSNNPKVVQPRTEYRGEIMQLTPGQVKKIVEIGGLRIQSFSDFETPHLIDMMQAVLDMSEKKLTSQAYTKVPNFAAVFGGTGIKINLSLIADGTGLDENGNLTFSSYEGMDINEALKLRDQYPDDVGTILVGVSDEHILAAMKSKDIDFIIPFHKSGWGKKQLEQLTAMRGYHDYTADQNERRVVGKTATGKQKIKKVEENFHPVDYWDYSKSGKENAEKYLRMCAKDGRIPKFARFLVNNGDGSYSLQPDGSTDGYWKLLGDFKMYNHKTGKGTPQRAVTPNFNMEEAERVLKEYEGGADTLPVAQDVVDDFVAEYKGQHPRAKYSLPNERDMRERYDRQSENTGGSTELMQRVTVDVWNALVDRKQHERAENYGQWKQHIGEMAAAIVENTNTSMDVKEIEKRLSVIFEEYERKGEGLREKGEGNSAAVAEEAVNKALNELRGLIGETISEHLHDEHYFDVKAALSKGIYLTREQVKELGGSAEMRDFRNALVGFTRVYTDEAAANRAGALHLDGHGWDELHSVDPDLFKADMHWLERAQAIRDFVDQNSDTTVNWDPVTRDFVRGEALRIMAEYYSGSSENDATKRTRDALKKANQKVDQLNRQLEESIKDQVTLADAVKRAKRGQPVQDVYAAGKTELDKAMSRTVDRAADYANRAGGPVSRPYGGNAQALQVQLNAARQKAQELSKQLTEAHNEAERLRGELNIKDNRAAYLENTIRILKKENKKNQEQAVRDDRRRNKERAEKRAEAVQARQNIKKTSQKLRRMMENPSNTQYIPKDYVRQLLDVVEAAQGADTRKVAQATEKWMRTVREMRTDSGNFYQANAFDQGFTDQMQEACDIMNDKRINDLQGEELQFVSNVLTQAAHQIDQAAKLIGRQRNEDAFLEGHNFTETINAQKGTATGGVKKAAHELAMQHLSPEREFNRLAGYRTDNAVHRAGQELVEGQRAQKMMEMELSQCFEGLMTGKNAKNFRKFAGKDAEMIDTGIQGSRHGTFKITHAQLTALLMHSMNEQNVNGMKNGLTVPDAELLKKGKTQEAWARAERMNLTPDQLRKLVAQATEYDKAWAAAWKQAQAIAQPRLNQTSMDLNGWYRFQVENYFPIRRDKNYLATDFESLQMDGTIAGMGFTKARKNATNPMMLEDIYTVAQRYINGTSLYVGMAIPVSNFNKVFNATMPGYEDSPKAALKRVFGSGEYEYLERLLTDIQTGGRKTDSSIMDKLRGKAAGSALGANVSVMIKQAASYPTAAAEIGWKPLMQALTSNRKFDEKLVQKYTSAYWERTSATVQAMNANTQANAIDRTSSLMGAGITGMDKATVRKIWIACEFAVEEENKNLQRGTDAYYEAVARKFELAVEHTQPEYGVMQRPHILRSNNQLTKAVTMYKTQSMQNFNVLYDAVQDYRAQAQRYKAEQSAENKAELDRAKVKMTRAISSQVVSAVVLALMTAVGKAVLHKPEPYQDDKGELTAGSVTAQLSKDMISSMAGMMVGGSELFELVTGIIDGKAPYDIEAGSISMVNDLYQAAFKLGNAASAIADSSLTTEQKMQKARKAGTTFLESVSAIYGIPMKNLENVGTGVYKYVDDIISGRGLEGMTTGDVTLTTGARYMGEALLRGDREGFARLYNRLLKQGKTQSQINSALRTWMKTGDVRVGQAAAAIDSGDIDSYNRLINEMSADGLGMANVVTVIEAVRKQGAAAASEEAGGRSEELESAGAPLTYAQIMEAQENDSASAYTYAQMNALLDSGNTRAAVQLQKQLFKSKGTTKVKSALTSYWKPKYREAYQSRNRAELNRITKLLKAMGYSESSINKWKSVDASAGNYNSSRSGFGSSGFGSGFGSSSKRRYSSRKKKSGFGGGFGSSSFGSGWGR